MPAFNYEQSIWGRGEAGLAWSAPTRFRLKQALFAVRKLNAGDSVVEVGCGAGQFIRSIKKNRPDLVCFGCDISQKAISLAQENNDSIRYSVCDEIKLPYADKSMDAVLVFDVLEHAREYGKLLEEINRILKTGGVFYCFVPCESDIASFWNALRVVNVGSDLTKKYAGHINYFTRRSLFATLKEHGFFPERLRYSEHFLGQAVGVAVFFLMDWKSKKMAGRQINNEEYFNDAGKPRNALSIVFRKFINILINLESTILAVGFSPNIHVISTKI